MRRRSFLACAGAFALAGARVPAASATLPMTVRDNRPAVELLMRGADGASRAVSCWVDTGGGDLVLAKTVAAALGLDAAGMLQGGGVERLQAVASPRVFAGSVEIYVPAGDVAMSLAGLSEIAPGAGVQATFPARLLRQHVVTFDYPARRFSLDVADPSGTRVPVQIDARSGFPRVEVTIGGASYGMLLDTGASCTLLSKALVDELKARNPGWKWVGGAYGSANMIGGSLEASAEMLRIPAVGVGAFTLRDVATVSRPVDTFERWMSALSAAPIVGSLGGNVLRNFRVVLDYPNSALWLERHDVAFKRELEIVPLTLTPSFDGTFTIAHVLASAKFSLPARELVGRRLLAAGGQSVAGKTLFEVQELLRGRAGSTCRLLVAGPGGTTHVLAPVVRVL